MNVQITERSEDRKYYIDGTFYETMPQQDKIDSWNYHPSFECANEVRIASLYCGESDINKIVPDVLHATWEGSNVYLKAHVRALLGARIDLNDHNFFDIIPEHVYRKHLGLKDRICEHVFANYPRPENYDYLLDLTRVLDQIKRYGLNLNTSGLKSRSVQDRNFAKRLAQSAPCCDYNIFGTRTGRLATNPNTFPILNLKKEYRGIVHPRLDCVVELDYNAAELRTVLALAGKPQPRTDIHQDACLRVFEGKITRDEVKTETFKWLYGGKSKYNKQLNELYDKETILSKHFFGDHIVTPFGKKIECDDHHALSYIIQSTLGEIVLRKLIEVNNFLKDYKSNVYFTVHDSIVLDFAEEDKSILYEISKIFSDTPLGHFPVSISAGTHYGNMKAVKWKV